MNYLSKYRGNRHSNLYEKAQEIRNISRRITDYLLPDMEALNEYGMENKQVYFTGDILRHSNSLLASIDKAETENFQDTRMKYVASVQLLTDRLYKTCERLENYNSNGKEFLQILRRELLKFRRLQRIWKLTI
ncbi:hypothetical protein MKO06_00560 [Gramella sp. GC03-9]|uniref:Uncharacterized protein n=1 Tax=Christiangramia oceanisediminis TaxID=2920386 RepID=A0A9X2I0G1_9FLAO|nr:hypothetical protein [Gramella oceanisediminis]MCP9198380.1 hypothetical protein [Gramella oceanisediminis]